MNKEWLFTREKEAAQPITDLPQLVAKSVANVKLLGTLKINKKFVKQATAEQLGMVVAQWLIQGAKQKSIQKSLVKQKVEPEYAKELLARVGQAVDDFKKTPEGKHLLSRKYRNQMIFGFIWFVIGLAVTIGTFMAASEGGTFLIAYGAIIWGMGGLVIGVIGWIKYSGGSK